MHSYDSSTNNATSEKYSDTTFVRTRYALKVSNGLELGSGSMVNKCERLINVVNCHKLKTQARGLSQKACSEEQGLFSPLSWT
jgi:hypothetical protein